MWRTYAFEPALEVDTCAPIAARVLVQTLVYVMSAVSSSEATALADGTSRSFLAHAPILAGVGVAVSSVLATFSAQFQRTVAPSKAYEIVFF